MAVSFTCVTSAQDSKANLEKDEAVENYRVGLLLCTGQIPGMLVSATAVQRVEFLVALAVGRAGCAGCAEQGWVLGRISDNALAVTGVTQWYCTCRCSACSVSS